MLRWLVRSGGGRCGCEGDLLAGEPLQLSDEVAFPSSWAETLLGQADSSCGDDPIWIDFYTSARFCADAVEIFRDLDQPCAAQRWSAGTEAATGFRRSAGLGGLVLASTYLQKPRLDLDAAVTTAQSALSSLDGVTSARATDYARDLADRFSPWTREPAVGELVQAILMRT